METAGVLHNYTGLLQWGVLEVKGLTYLAHIFLVSEEKSQIFSLHGPPHHSHISFLPTRSYQHLANTTPSASPPVRDLASSIVMHNRRPKTNPWWPPILNSSFRILFTLTDVSCLNNHCYNPLIKPKFPHGIQSKSFSRSTNTKTATCFPDTVPAKC